MLLLLYGWTLTEKVPLTVEVRDGVCTAVLEDRSSAIPCPGLEAGATGIYLTSTPAWQRIWSRPLDLFAPATSWQAVHISHPGQPQQIDLLRKGQADASGALFSLPAPQSTVYTVQGSIGRPDGELAGVLLLDAQQETGWIFLVNSENRQGIWRQWREGRPAEAIVGIPYQKPLLAQTQSFLRQVLTTFLGALLLIGATAALERVGKWIRGRFGRMRAAPAVHYSRLPHARAPYPELIILFTLFGLTLWIAVDLLERIPHVQDSLTLLFQAQTLAEGAFWAPEPPQSHFFLQEFLTVLDGKWFGQYPPGYPAVLAIGVLAGAPWLVNPWLAVLSAALLIKLGLLLYRSATGLLAGTLALLSPFYLFLSGSLMGHTAELFWSLLAMVSWTLALKESRRARWALLSGAALGMLLVTRQITAVIVAASFLALLFFIESWRPRHAWPEKATAPAPQFGLLVVALFPFLLLLLAYQAALTGSPWQDPRLLSRPFDKPGFGQHIGERENAFRLASLPEGIAVTWYSDVQQPPRGHTAARGLFNGEENWGALADHLFGWYPLFALAFCWLPFLLGPTKKYDWLLLTMIAVTIAAYVAYWHAGIMFGPRYYFVALPALLLLTARGLQSLSQHSGRGATGFLFALLLLSALVNYWPDAIASLHGYNFIDAQEQRLVGAQIDGPALLFVPVKEWWDYGRFFSGNTPWLDGSIIYAHDLGDEQNGCLQAAFPERAAYRWDPQTESVTQLVTREIVCAD